MRPFFPGLLNMIEARDLKKQFGTRKAVDGVSFSVAKGEVLGFLGPNGAGKSTTMRMITGYLPPTSGHVEIGGRNMLADPVAAKRLIGYLPENAPSYPEMTVLAFLNFCAAMHGIAAAKVNSAVWKAMETCFLEPVRHQTIETLSKGFRHRVCLAQAIIHDPEVLVLDEPTDGLDPNQKHEVRTLIRRMGESKAIIFSTHILEEVEAACTRAIIIDRGRIVANGTPAELKARAPGAGRIRVRLGDGADHSAAFAKLDGAASATFADGRIVIVPAASKDPAALARAAAELAGKERWSLLELRVEEGRLDDVFRSITSKDTGGNK